MGQKKEHPTIISREHHDRGEPHNTNVEILRNVESTLLDNV